MRRREGESGGGGAGGHTEVAHHFTPEAGVAVAAAAEKLLNLPFRFRASHPILVTDIFQVNRSDKNSSQTGGSAVAEASRVLKCKCIDYEFATQL